MEPTTHYRPTVSRETRRLLLAGTLAVAALWLLARIRFEDRPVTPNPVPAVLSQLQAPPSYDDLADTLAQLQARVTPALVAVDSGPAAIRGAARRAALRWRDGLALAVLPRPDSGAEADPRIVAQDPTIGLAVVRVPAADAVLAPPVWTPRREQQPRYLFATDVAAGGITLRPVYVGALAPVTSPLWPEPVWAVPAGATLAPGTLVFSSAAEFAGVAIADDSGTAIVPGDSVLNAAARLLSAPSRAATTLGVEVQPLTPALAAVTGAAHGVVVTWVAPGEGGSPLQVGDVVEALDGQPMLTLHHWQARTAALAAGQRATARVRRGAAEPLTLTLTATPARGASPALGLGLRAVPGSGSEVTRVDRGSAADRAGVQRGDLITRLGSTGTPTPAQVSRGFGALAEGQRALLAVTRGDAHHVLVLER